MARRGRPPYPDVLTPREWEVLDLLRTGLSNPEIAERLGISRDGVKYHVSEILSKLGVSSREEAGLLSVAEVRRPWWMAAFAPIGFVWRKTGQAIAVAVLAAAGVAFGLFALLVACSSTNDQPATVHEVAYIDTDGAIVLYDADSGESRIVADIACGTPSAQPKQVVGPQLSWSPDGKTLACLVSSETPTGGRAGMIALIDVESGASIGRPRVQADGALYWAPAGDVFAYIRSGIVTACGAACTGLADSVAFYNTAGEQITFLEAQYLTAFGPAAWSAWGWPLWSPDGSKIVYKAAWKGGSELGYKTLVLDIATGEETLQQGDVPLAWAFNEDGIITAGNYRRESADAFPSYRAQIIKDFLELRTLAELDNGVQFWVAPGGEKVVYLTPGFAPVEGGTVPGLGVLDLSSGEAMPIEGSLITYGSDHIPQEWVTFSEDGEDVYWVGGDGVGYRAKMDGTSLTELISGLDTFDFSWSSDHQKIFYVQQVIGQGTSGSSYALYVAEGDGSNPRLVEQAEDAASESMSFSSAAWRPVVPSAP